MTNEKSQEAPSKAEKALSANFGGTRNPCGDMGAKVQKEALKKLTDIYSIPKPECHEDKRKGRERGPRPGPASTVSENSLLWSKGCGWTTDHSKNLLHSNREPVLRLWLLLPF